MENQLHIEIGDIIIATLWQKGLIAAKSVSASGSVYVYIVGTRFKIRIADHGKHGKSYFRYNLRTDLKIGRIQYISKQRVFFFTSSEIEHLCFRIGLDYRDEEKRNVSAIVKKHRRIKQRRVYGREENR